MRLPDELNDAVLYRRCGVRLVVACTLARVDRGVVPVLPIPEGHQAVEKDGGRDRDEDHRTDLEEERVAHRPLRSPARSSVPSDWIDGTQSPTKMPAVLSSATKYRYTDSKNDTNAAAN